MSEKQQRLVLSIIDFLNNSINNGVVKADDKESLEVASTSFASDIAKSYLIRNDLVQCIGEAFGVDPSNKEQVEKLSVKPASLESIFDVYMKTRDNFGARAQSSSTPAAPASTSKELSAEDKTKADKLKQEGNSLMSGKKYDEAIEAYTKAIAIDGSNPVYYSNRAAAYSSKNDHLSAIGDAEKAIALDQSFSKGYHRLGCVQAFFCCAQVLTIFPPRHAQYCLGDFQAAADAFERGLKIDPSNSGLKSGLANAKGKLPSASDPSSRAPPSSNVSTGAGADVGGMADMFRSMGGGGGAGGGGMPDLASLMGNPQIMSMAQQLAANGGLERMMQNPALADMVPTFTLRCGYLVMISLPR